MSTTNAWKCLVCGNTKAKVSRENEPMAEVMQNVVLRNVEVTKCLTCGEREIAIPKLDNLMKAIATAIIHKPGRLNGVEIRFMRTYVELDGTEFAQMLDVTPSTVSRWENGRTPVGTTADLLLRAIIMLNRGELVPISGFRGMAMMLQGMADVQPARYEFEYSETKAAWDHSVSQRFGAFALKKRKAAKTAKGKLVKLATR